MPLKFTVSERKVLPNGVYPAELIDVTEREKDNRPYLLWIFGIATEHGEQKLYRPTSTSFGPNSFARTIVESLLNRTLVGGEEIDLTTLVGLRCEVLVTSTADAAGRTVNRIAAVLPASDGDDVPD